MPQAILDGLTFDGNYPGKGWQGPFTYKFRPALNPRITAYRDSIRNATPKLITQRQCEFLKDHMQGWDRTDAAGNLLDIKDNLSYETLSEDALLYLITEIMGHGDADLWRTQQKN